MDPITGGAMALGGLNSIFGGGGDKAARDFAWRQQEEGQSHQQRMWNQQSAYGTAESQKQRDWASQEAKNLREWQTNMSNSQYQRQAADMEKAGINKLYMTGSGAGTPSGGMPSGSTASSGAASAPGGNTPTRLNKRSDYFNAIKDTVNNALEVKRLKKEVFAVDSQAKLNLATAKMQDATAERAINNARESQSRKRHQDMQNDLLEKSLPYEVGKREVKGQLFNMLKKYYNNAKEYNDKHNTDNMFNDTKKMFLKK